MELFHLLSNYKISLRCPCASVRIPNRNIEIHDGLIVVTHFFVAVISCMGAIICKLAIITSDNAYMSLISERFRIIHDTSGKGSVPRTSTSVEHNIIIKHIVCNSIVSRKLSWAACKFPTAGVLIPFTVFAPHHLHCSIEKRSLHNLKSSVHIRFHRVCALWGNYSHP